MSDTNMGDWADVPPATEQAAADHQAEVQDEVQAGVDPAPDVEVDALGSAYIPAPDADELTALDGDQPAENEPDNDTLDPEVLAQLDEYVLTHYTDDDIELEPATIGEAKLNLAIARDVGPDEDAYLLLDKDGNVLDAFRTDVPFGLELVDGQMIERRYASDIHHPRVD